MMKESSQAQGGAWLTDVIHVCQPPKTERKRKSRHTIGLTKNFI